VFTCGIGDTADVWSDIASHMSGQAKTLCWDLRGHGDSDRPDDPDQYQSEHAVSDLMSMISQVGGSLNNPVVLVGHSLGGYLSLKAALQSPNQIGALILIATGPGYRDTAAREEWNKFAVSMRLGDSVHPAASQLGVQNDGSVLSNLSSIRVPTLVIVGSHDRRFLAAKDYMVRKIPKATGIVIPDGRHSVHRTHPDLVGRAMLSFLREASLIS
jgi:pimeloyl-ACP methyl ester carboxylesterase